MMQPQGEIEGERGSIVPVPGIENSLSGMLNTASGVADSFVQSGVAQPEVSTSLAKAFRQSWEHHWISPLIAYAAKGRDLRDCSVSFDVTELVSADLLQGSCYTKAGWSMPTDYKEGVIACLNNLLAPVELEIESFHHRQDPVEEKRGFFDGLFRGKEIANHSGENKHSFELSVRSVHYARYAGSRYEDSPRHWPYEPL